MFAVFWLAASSVAAWVGIEVYDNMTRQERIDTCVAEVKDARPSSDINEIIKACEIIVR